MVMTWGWPLTSVYCRSYEWLEPFLHSYICIHGVYRNSFTFILHLYQARVGLFINPLNAKLNPICSLLALLGAHHILHVSRIRVKFRLALCEPRVLCFDSSNYNFTSGNFIFSRIWRTARPEAFRLTLGATSIEIPSALGKGKVHLCTGTEAVYRPYGP